MNIDYSKSYWKNDKVRLRLAAAEDWEGHFHSRFDSDARFFLNCEVELPAEPERDALKWQQFISPDAGHGRIVFTVEALDGTVVGGFNLNSIDERNGTFSIGMQMYVDSRGKGYGTAAMELILDYAFNERRLHKYYGYVVEGNTASETMLQKLGCTKEGVRREMIFHQGRYWDEIHYGLTADEFNNRKR